jgi:putative endonuclease
MALWSKLKFWDTEPEHLKRGAFGENAAREFLERKGLKFLTANFAGPRGEVDLIFRDGECLVFVEVKTRAKDGWTRPARAVDARKRRAIVRTATDYLRLLDNPRIPYRFDVVEVLLEGQTIREVRHIENSFNSTMTHVRGR